MKIIFNLTVFSIFFISNNNIKKLGATRKNGNNWSFQFKDNAISRKTHRFPLEWIQCYYFFGNTRLNYILFTTKFSLQLSMLLSSRKERLCSPCKSLKCAIVISLQLSWSNVFHHSSPIILSLLENISIGSLRKTSHSSFKICRKIFEKRKRFVPERPYNEGQKIFEKF